MDFKPTLNETLLVRFDDKDEIQDIVDHGITAGYHGFIYTYELNEFFSEYEDELENYYWEIFGDNWISEFSSNTNSTSLDELRAKMIWGYVESWCQDTLEELEEEMLNEMEVV